MKRRSLLKGSVAASTLLVAAGAGILKPAQLLAAEYPASTFNSTDINSALNAVFGTTDVADSADIKIKAPVQAENGAVVPVKITAKGAEQMAVVVEGNPQPLVMTLDIKEGATGYISGRVKMGQTSNLTCYAKQGGKITKASQEIKVTVGGCGG